MSSYESDDFDKEEYGEIWSKSGWSGTFSTILGRFLRGLVFPLGFEFSAGESCDGDGGSLAIP